MVENKKLRLKYSKNARKFVIKKFSRKKVLNLYKNYFKDDIIMIKEFLI